MARNDVSCEKSRKRNVKLGNQRLANRARLRLWKKIVRYRGLTAHARARYRCFLPDLAGLAGVRRVRPIPDLNHSSIQDSKREITTDQVAPPCALFEGWELWL